MNAPTASKKDSPKRPSGKPQIEAAFNKLQRAMRPGAIPAEELVAYVGARLMQQADRVHGLAGMALEDGNATESLEYEGIARDLDSLAQMILKHNR